MCLWGFPISRDPPEGGTVVSSHTREVSAMKFPISRDPPEGGTSNPTSTEIIRGRPRGFQFLGIPPKGEPTDLADHQFGFLVVFPISRDPPEGGTKGCCGLGIIWDVRSFQFLGIPPKGEQLLTSPSRHPGFSWFPISRDPPEGGTNY